MVIAMVWVITNDRSRYQMVHACNVMFSAVNFLPGQVWCYLIIIVPILVRLSTLHI